MATIELVRFLNDSANELLNKAEAAQPAAAETMVDEAEELLALGASILKRHKAFEVEILEAA